MLTSVARFGAFFVLTLGGVVFAPGAASAQTLNVAPTSVTAVSSAGQDAPSQTVTVRNAGGKALKWTVGAVVTASGGNWLSVSPSRGTQTGNVMLTFQTSALPQGSYQASFGISSNGGSATVNVQLTVGAAAALPPPPPPTVPKLAVSCPGNQSVTSLDGKSVVVNYSATTSGGVAPVTWTGNPASGSAFPVGTTSVAVTAQSSDGQNATCGFTITVTYTAPTAAPPPPTSTSAVGPQSTITCPAGAVTLSPGDPIPQIVGSFPNNTTFCLRAGTHYLTSSITPKTGDVFVGEYGAILDGSNWSTTDVTQAAFRAHNQDIDYVTIRNLVIRKMPQRGIHSYYWMSDHWTVEYNEIASNANMGIVLSPSEVIRNNYIHHNTLGGYGGQQASYTTLEGNEIAYNGGEQKVGASTNVTFRNNFVHHNIDVGIWFDSNNIGTLIEGNRVEDNGWMGIFYEISHDATIRNNTIRRNAEAGIMLSVSNNVQIYGNTLDSNFRGITYFLNCSSVGGEFNFDLTNNTAHDNVITINSTQSGAYTSVFSYLSSCTSTQVAPYVNGSKNLTFSHNTYHVPLLNGAYWVWGPAGKSWNEWQALGQDVDGTMGQ